MNTKSKSALSKELAGPLLTRDDIAALLVAYYGAVKLDAVLADDLCQRCSDRKQDRESCEENRMDHLRHIYLLLDTLSHISQETLAKLTVLATTCKPTVVRQVLRRLLAEGSAAHLMGERMWTAPEFFSALVKETNHGARAPKDGEDAFERMMRWLDPLDPLRTSRGCGYRKSMPPRIWR
jgi:hypothetical protein